MSTIPDRTPVIVGVGQVVDRIEAGDYRALSAADLAAAAAEAALADSGAAPAVRPLVRVVGAVRTFEDSGAAPSPFGRPGKFPLAVARRLGVTPDHAILGKVGGDTPVSMVMELGDRILAGETDAAIAFGAEAISTTRHLSGRGETGPNTTKARSTTGASATKECSPPPPHAMACAEHRSPTRCWKTRGARGWACRGRTMRWKWGGCSRRSRRLPPPIPGAAPHPRR